MISRDRVLELVSYDPDTGVFIRLKSRAHWVGKPAGKTDSQGARQILLESTNKSGFKGVSRVKWKGKPRWRATVSADSVRHVEHFHCLGQAIKHVKKTREELHGEFANHGAIAA